MSRSRHYCFTFFPAEGRELYMKDNDKVKYIIGGKEICPKTKTEHIQGYAYFKREVSLKVAQKSLCNYKMNMRACKGTPEENFNYCSKDGEYEEYGERPNQGKRNDIHQINEMIEQKVPLKEIVRDATSYQSMRMAELKYKYLEEERPIIIPDVYWIFGGTARERKCKAYMLGEGAYRPLSDKWWDGYDGEETVIIEEIDEKYCTAKRLNQLTDCFPFRVETKGGSRQVQYNRIIITSESYPMLPLVDDEVLKRLNLRNICAEVGGNTSPDLVAEDTESILSGESSIDRYINSDEEPSAETPINLLINSPSVRTGDSALTPAPQERGRAAGEFPTVNQDVLNVKEIEVDENDYILDVDEWDFNGEHESSKEQLP